MKAYITTITEFTDKVKSGGITAKRMYICSPLHAAYKAKETVNMLIARDKCNVLNGFFSKYNIKVWAAHAHLPMFLDDNIQEERELAIEFGLKLLNMSDAVYVFGEYLSNGMKGEITRAVELNLPIIVEPNLDTMVREFVNGIDTTSPTEGGEDNA